MAERKDIDNGAFNAKGDLLGGTADDAYTQVAVGTNGKALLADADASSGLSYGVPHLLSGLGYKSGFLYPPFLAGVNTALTPTEARLYCIPFLCRRKQTFDQITTFQNSNGGAGCVVRLGIYLDDGDGYPGALLLDAGTYAASAGGSVQKNITISQSVPRGLVWLAFAVQGASGSPSPVNAQPATTFLHPFSFATTAFALASAWIQASVTGALPNPFTTTPAQTVTTVPNVWLRAA